MSVAGASTHMSLNSVTVSAWVISAPLASMHRHEAGGLHPHRRRRVDEPVITVGRDAEHRRGHVEHPGRFVEDVVLFGGQGHPAGVGAAANPSAHAGTHVPDAGLADHAGHP